MPDYIFSARNINGNSFGDDADSVLHYLVVPDDAGSISPQQEISQKEWLVSLVAETENLPRPEDILIYVHGFNNSETDVLKRHQTIKKGLHDQGYFGKVVTFDWPCGNDALMYLPDRHKAKQTAMQLVNGGIALLAAQQMKDCTINIHVLAHSTGAYVVREAFDDADDTNVVDTKNDDLGTVSINAVNWMVTQMIFVEGDVSSGSMSADSPDSKSIYKHVVRLTNYSNPYDKVLALSNVKRAGFANRAGRVGLPIDAPDNSVNVNCGKYYNTITNINPLDIAFSHSWYFDEEHNSVFMQDLAETIKGDTDRNYIATRENDNGQLFLSPIVPFALNQWPLGPIQ